VYRLGGEEFAIIVAAGASVAAQVADRVRMGVSQERRLRLPTISAGVACFPDDAAGASALLHRADVALYAAKRTGRDRVVLFAPEHDADRSAAAAESTAALAHPPSGHVIRSIVRSELAALADAVGGIGVAVDRERVLAGACREVARVLAASSCTIRQLRAGCLAPVAASDARRGGYGYRADDFPLVRASLSDGRARAVAIGDAECDPAAADVLDAAGARAGLLVPLRMAGEPWGLLEVLDADRQTFDDDELCVAELIGGHIAAAVARLDHVDDLRRRYREAIAALASALDGRHAVDPHRALAVSDLAVRVGLRLRLPAEELRRVELTGLLHGLVLVGVPVDVLLADTPLDAGGREAVRGGAVDAAATLAEILPLADVPAAVRACRERWDGSGYPDGLAGEQIPVAARVVAACAAWIALNEARPWRPALGERRAERELRAVAGSQLDPASVAALLTVLVDLEAEASPPRLLRPRGAGDGARTS
jgi:GAF domain-containing protein